MNYDDLLKLRFWSCKLVERLFPFGDFEPKQNRTVTVGKAELVIGDNSAALWPKALLQAQEGIRRDAPRIRAQT